MPGVDRRRFLIAASTLVVARGAKAQGLKKVHRVGYLAINPPHTVEHLLRAFDQGLAALGYVQGRNLALDLRHADGKLERLPQTAAEIVRGNPDVIMTSINAQTHAAKKATQTIPIVMIVGTDVVKEGFVASLARPGGNITGLTWDAGLEIVAKRFELLKESVTGLSRVAVLWDPG